MHITIFNYALFAMIVIAIALLRSNYGEGRIERIAPILAWGAILSAFWLFVLAEYGVC